MNPSTTTGPDAVAAADAATCRRPTLPPLTAGSVRHHAPTRVGRRRPGSLEPRQLRPGVAGGQGPRSGGLRRVRPRLRHLRRRPQRCPRPRHRPAAGTTQRRADPCVAGRGGRCAGHRSVGGCDRGVRSGRGGAGPAAGGRPGIRRARARAPGADAPGRLPFRVLLLWAGMEGGRQRRTLGVAASGRAGCPSPHGHRHCVQLRPGLRRSRHHLRRPGRVAGRSSSTVDQGARLGRGQHRPGRSLPGRERLDQRRTAAPFRGPRRDHRVGRRGPGPGRRDADGPVPGDLDGHEPGRGAGGGTHPADLTGALGAVLLHVRARRRPRLRRCGGS